MILPSYEKSWISETARSGPLVRVGRTKCVSETRDTLRRSVHGTRVDRANWMYVNTKAVNVVKPCRVCLAFVWIPINAFGRLRTWIMTWERAGQQTQMSFSRAVFDTWTAAHGRTCGKNIKKKRVPDNRRGNYTGMRGDSRTVSRPSIRRRLRRARVCMLWRTIKKLRV